MSGVPKKCPVEAGQMEGADLPAREAGRRLGTILASGMFYARHDYPIEPPGSGRPISDSNRFPLKLGTDEPARRTQPAGRATRGVSGSSASTARGVRTGPVPGPWAQQ